MAAMEEPTIRIRELAKDRVDFVMSGVDLACVDLLGGGWALAD
jgi:DNA-directed RNA polymerase II subunit RPB3